jgi:hypothetical protein
MQQRLVLLGVARSQHLPRRCHLLSLLLLLLLPATTGRVIDFATDLGAIPDDGSHATCLWNAKILSDALQHNSSHNTLVIPYNQTFHLGPGVYAHHVHDAVLQLDGVLRFERLDKKQFRDKATEPCIRIDRSRNVTLTSQYRGLIDGRGSQYWGVPMVGYIQLAENRPRLLVFNRTTDLLIENIVLQDSPYHTLKLHVVNRVEVRNISIVARRTTEDGHGWVDLSAFNTDGIDVSGHNVHIHDVDIWTQDDCIAVKDNNDTETMDFVSSNMTFENINASGLGLVIGSIGGSTVRNITFRNSYLHRSVKGVYLKFNRPDQFWQDHNMTAGVIEDVLFENITMESPLQFGIFIGPAQQADHRDPCHPNPCSLCWPWSPTAKCHIVSQASFRNITLRNVLINNPNVSPGVIMGDESNPMESIVFDNVRVTKGPLVPYATEDRTVTFPGLLQRVDDRYVVSSVFAGMEESALLMNERRLLRQVTTTTRRSNDQSDSSSNYTDDHLSFGKQKWQRTNSYFRCMGVRGVAQGPTWPVPDCFEVTP